MTRPQTISLRWQGFPHELFMTAKAGSVWHLFVHGVEYPPHIREKPPRVRLLEDVQEHAETQAELIDPWPGAPATWPEQPYGFTPPPAPAPKKRGRR